MKTPKVGYAGTGRFTATPWSRADPSSKAGRAYGPTRDVSGKSCLFWVENSVRLLRHVGKLLVRQVLRQG